MNEKDLISLLGGLAEKDLSPGSSIYDHPCSVAIRTLTDKQKEIDALKLKAIKSLSRLNKPLTRKPRGNV